MRTVAIAALLAVASLGLDAPPPAPFRDVTAEWGIAFEHHSDPEKRVIVESMSGGVAVFDFDNDGRPDIYFVDALTVKTASNPAAARSTLYRNLGGGRFEDVTDRAGVGHPGWGMGACAGDVDGDGWIDLYVTGFGGSHLYRNGGNGTFSDVTAATGLAVGGFATGCAFADYDRDGRLDLFVSRYVHVDLANLPQFGQGKTCQFRGIPVQCGPRGLAGESDVLFHNDGGLHFSDVSRKAGVSDPDGYFGLGLAWFDENDDGWPDLFVANDSTPNYLYVNRRDGTFREDAFTAGVAVSDDGAEQGTMGVAVGAYDNSPRFSLFVTNFAEEYNVLYRNDGDRFVDVSFRAGVAASSMPYVGWGDAFLDYDNDGLLDIIAVNGHVYPQLDLVPHGAAAGYRQPTLLFHNRGNGTFEDVSAAAGPVFTEPRVARGLAVADLDDDGRLDVVINQLDGRAQVLHNEWPTPGHWLGVRLVGKGGNRQAIGAVVMVKAGPLSVRRLVQAGTSYLSQSDTRVHVGLGTASRADSIEVRWPDGRVTTETGVAADRYVEIVEP